MATPATMEPSSPDLMALGKHCHVLDCRQLDFLPFNCQHCKHTFCLEHRQAAQHHCTAVSASEPETVLCPLCAKAIRVQPGEDANAAWERHSRTGTCDPANYAAVHAKRACPVKGCREKLTTSNKYTCRDCGKEVCLKHRFSASHACVGQQRRQQGGGAPTSSASRLLAAWTGQAPQPASKQPSSSGANKMSEWLNKLSFGGNKR